MTKEYIATIKDNGVESLTSLIKSQRDVKSINFILENIGQFPDGFDDSFLFDMLKHVNAQVRLNVVKNIGKIKNNKNPNKLFEHFQIETDSNVKREIVSSIGRQRNIENKQLLLNFLNDIDPKVICQTIRALIVFNNDKDVVDALKPLINHENEMVRTIIYKEFFSKHNNKSNVSPTESLDILKNKVVNADVIDVMKLIPEESIHLTFTSPPYYNARDYSIYPSYIAYLDFLETVFKDIHRITKEGRFLIVNTSPIIIPRVSRAHSSKRYGIPFDLHTRIVNNGWEFIDDIVWLKPEASVKNRIGGFMQHRKPLGYKPNCVTEYLMVYRKSTEKLLDWNIRNYNESTIKDSLVSDGYESTNVWKIDPCFDKIHSAIFPAELCKRVIEYYSYKGDLVFDPFGGSGTVGKTAKALGRYFFLTEKDKTYFDYMISKKRPEGLLPELPTEFLTFEQFSNSIK